MKPLKIYTDLAAVPRINDNTRPLIPVLRVFMQNIPLNPLFERLAASRFEHFELTSSPAEADAAVLPADWNYYRISAYQATDRTELAHEFVDHARKYQLPVFVFHHSDNDKPIPLDAIVCRTNLYASHMPPRTMAYPSFSDAIPGQLAPRSKSNPPIVGFCGNAHTTWKKTLKHYAKTALRLLNSEPTFSDPSRLRVRALNLLEKSPAVSTNFVIRSSYYGGVAAGDQTQRYETVRAEYLQNMAVSDYIPCIRGAGNYSIRFYETMRGGRIPIFIDTDCVLPYRESVDWKSLMVWVDQHNIAQIGDRVRAFHETLSPADFLDLQARIHRAWDEWLSPHGFFQHLHLALEQFA